MARVVCSSALAVRPGATRAMVCASTGVLLRPSDHSKMLGAFVSCNGVFGRNTPSSALPPLDRGSRSFADGNAGGGYRPIFSTVYALAQKSGGPSLSGTLFVAGLTPRFRYAAIARSSTSDMKRHPGQGIGGAR